MIPTTPIDMESMARDIRALKVAQAKSDVRHDGITLILNQLIQANPEAVNWKDIRETLMESYGHPKGPTEDMTLRREVHKFLTECGYTDPA